MIRSNPNGGGEDQLSRSSAALFRRFTQLNDGEQLETYQAIVEWLHARHAGIAPDKKLTAQAESVAALRRVADHLALADVEELQVKSFDSAPADVRGGWSSGRVIKAHGMWSFAREAAAGGRAIPTKRQAAVLKARVRGLKSEDYIAAVRQWLDTKPNVLGTSDYDTWVREQRAPRGGSLRLPGYNAVRDSLRLKWSVVLAVARGEMTLAKAQRDPGCRIDDSGTGLFIVSREIATLAGLSHQQVRTRAERDDFPTCVLLCDYTHYYYRADVLAYLAGEKFPKRKVQGLNGRYVGSAEAAKLVGVVRDAVHRVKGMPKPAYKGGRTLWLKSEVEAFCNQRRRDGVATGYWKRSVK